MDLDPLVFRPRWGRAAGRVLEQIRARQAQLVAEWMPRDPLPGEIDTAPRGTRRLRGGDLRAALRQVLVTAARPLTVDELYRGLLARGLRPHGRPSKRISDALRWEIRAGRVEQVRRGEYVSVAA